jgi:RimJ/RimL family protein N-acetyltransferase
MVPLAPEAAEPVLSWEDGSRRAVALHHALHFRRPGLWGDHPRRPRSVVLLRRGQTCWEAFGAGQPEPAASWLSDLRAPVALLAPDGWEPEVQARVREPIDRTSLTVRFLQEAALRPRSSSPSRSPGRMVQVRPLSRADAGPFAESAPAWAWRAWDSPEQCLDQGAAFGVPYLDSFAALAWITEQDRHLDLVGVYTVPRYRGLGLGRAVAAALVAHILGPRRKDPLWATTEDNEASKALAGSLGFTLDLDEPILRWGDGPLADDPGPQA